MSLDGRHEKRIPIELTVCLVSAGQPREMEQAFTENVSFRGARVVTKRRWHSGEQPRVSSLTGEFYLPARVVYCHPRPNGSFGVGLEFKGRTVKWWDGDPNTAFGANGG